MKRFHVHVSVPDLAASIRFYSALFGAQPSVVKDDYAKWMLEDPRVNFAISSRGGRAGVNHLGLQTDSDAELASLAAQLHAADLATQAEHEVACCYARSNKHWVTDPSGVAWETFHTLGSVPTFNDAGAADGAATGAAAGAAMPAGCCEPAPAAKGRPVPVPVSVAVKSQSCCG